MSQNDINSDRLADLQKCAGYELIKPFVEKFLKDDKIVIDEAVHPFMRAGVQECSYELLWINPELQKQFDAFRAGYIRAEEERLTQSIDEFCKEQRGKVLPLGGKFATLDDLVTLEARLVGRIENARDEVSAGMSLCSLDYRSTQADALQNCSGICSVDTFFQTLFGIREANKHRKEEAWMRIFTFDTNEVLFCRYRFDNIAACHYFIKPSLGDYEQGRSIFKATMPDATNDIDGTGLKRFIERATASRVKKPKVIYVGY